ncbi:MAG TPA: hypothetical protein VEP90_16865 [Methylomirabilota bacterium]|nr:hypothetical protein [Methylomirabilota bacterium]
MSYKDYRYQDYQAITQGNAVIAAGATQYDTERVLSFPLPNVTSMCLDVAYTTWVESQHFLRDENVLEFPKPQMPEKTIRLTEDYIFFDLLQKRMIAIVFAYTALESFANESIPDHFIFRSKRQDKKCTEEYTKEQAERLSLETKLYEVLPEIFKLPPPKGRTIGHKYKSLEKLRDRIIHVKTKDRRSLIAEEENIWKALLDRSFPNVAIEAKEIIGYYVDSLEEDNKPRWYTEFPWKK